MEEAIKLNNVFVEMNISAFRWGRMAAHNLKYVEKESLPFITNIEIDHENYKLTEIIDDRIKILTNYQNKNYADKYKNIINKTISVEKKINKESEILSTAVAKYLHKLMSYKDEYEVARLYSDGQFKEKINNTFEGKLKIKFHLAPPLFAPKNPNTGKLKKITIGSWIMTAFKILTKFKFLRGSIFDPFGKTKERKMERYLIEQYINDINKILNELNKDKLFIATQIASVPEIIRGYGHIKEENIIKAQEKRKQLLENWKSSKNLKPESDQQNKFAANIFAE